MLHHTPPHISHPICNGTTRGQRIRVSQTFQLPKIAQFEHDAHTLCAKMSCFAARRSVQRATRGIVGLLSQQLRQMILVLEGRARCLTIPTPFLPPPDVVPRVYWPDRHDGDAAHSIVWTGGWEWCGGGEERAWVHSMLTRAVKTTTFLPLLHFLFGIRAIRTSRWSDWVGKEVGTDAGFGEMAVEDVRMSLFWATPSEFQRTKQRHAGRNSVWGTFPRRMLSTQSEGKYHGGQAIAVDFTPLRVRRHNASFFPGAHEDDDAIIAAWNADSTDHVAQLRRRCAEAIDTKNSDEFLAAARDACLWMERLPRQHPYHWPEKFGFWWCKEAPANKILVQALRQLFGLLIANFHNGAGIAVGGPRGVGKTHLLRLIVVLSGLLVPDHTVSCYVDFKSMRHRHLPAVLIDYSINVAPSHTLTIPAAVEALWRAQDQERGEPPSIDVVLGKAADQGRIVVFVANEISRVYGAEHWDDLHALATSTSSFTVVADSGSKLRAMLQRSDIATLNRHFPTFRENNRELPHSLNDDKLKVRLLHPLRTREEYEKYLERRSVAVGLCEESVKADAVRFVNALHTVSGGRLRCMDTFFDNLSTEPLPARDSVDFFILTKMAEDTSHEVTSTTFDPFNPPSFPFLTIKGWLDAWHHGHGHGDSADVATLLDNNTITEHPTEADKFTFGTPLDYTRVRGLVPSVAVSFAFTDQYEEGWSNVVKVIGELQSAGVNVVMCTDDAAVERMAKSSMGEASVRV